MPLLRRGKPGESVPPVVETTDALAAELRHPDPEQRWSAARQLGDRPGAAEHLAAALMRETEPRVVEAIFTSLARRGGEESAPHLFPLLRSDDAALRNGAIEALETMPAALAGQLEALLRDLDSDVRIFAVELTRKMPAESATASLCALLDRETHPNVCAAAIDVLAESGSLDAIPHLERCRDRFATQPFLPFAIAIAIETLSRTAH
jgi:HEAT repeat protein